MEARIKKLFHRKKGDLSQLPLAEDHDSDPPNSNAALRTSLYDSTSPRDPPQMGTHSIKGNYNATVSPSHTSPVSGGGPFHSPPHSLHHGMRPASTIPRSDGPLQRNSEGLSPRDAMTVCENADERRQRLPKILVSDLQRPLGSDFDSQDYEENGQRRDVTSKVTEAYPHGLDTPSPLKPLGKATEHQRKHTKSSSLGTSMSSSKAPDDDPNPIRDTPIPWDDPGSQRRIPVSDSQLSSKFHQSLPSESASPTPNAIAANNIQFGERSNDDSLSWPTTNSPGTIHAAKQVIEQAHSNSTHTDVTETLAPAVVHETFRQDTHQIRQEVITREIHNHDYYHRVLPIVDVEVLPARHFLPVEGGGLVEISADEVPGRGRHWVVAETASRIPSDQPAPQAINRFSARKFTGSEGDFKKYITPEGYERTEETWVHPPELETGARDTGQTWPLVLGGEPDQNIHGRFGSPSKRQSKKPRRVAVESEKTV